MLSKLDGGLMVTPYHPVRFNGEWTFPHQINAATEMQCDGVFSFVLDRSTSEHVMMINGFECVALAHGITAKNAAHPYFGSERVLNDLQRMNGWAQGRVELVEGCTVRDPASGLVSGLRQESS